MFPARAVLCVYGAFAINNNVFDILTMLSFSLVGFLMLYFEMSPVPFMIAFVLGPMLEKCLRRPLVISDGNPMIFLKSPIAVICFIFTIFGVVSITRGALRKIKD